MVRWQRSTSFAAAEPGVRALAAYAAMSLGRMNRRG
jgi:hypothetical protein